MTDESRLTQNRDAALERLLQRMPAGPDGRGPGPCLEPETLAAWMDGTLTAADRGIAEGHAAGCDRCQAMLAAMVRSEPPVQPARWWSAGAIRWAVPLVAGAAVFALWVAIDPEALRSPGRVPVAPIATPPPPAPSAGNLSTARQAPSRSDAPAAAPAKDRAAAKTLESAKEEVVSRADSVAAPGPPTLLDKKADESGVPLAQRNESKAAAVPEARNQSAAATPPAAAAAAGGQGVVALSARGGAPGVIASPAAPTRWRIVSPGRVDRSIDAGTTWTVTDLPAGAQVTAGASPAAGICWLVGRDGLVLRTLDGSTWTRILFPEALALTAVEASSADAAVVTSDSGRSFATSDGGRTWMQR